MTALLEYLDLNVPVDSHGFYLRIQRCCLSWNLSGVPCKCHCGKPFSVDHSMICPTGGFPIIRHNEVRDFTTAYLWVFGFDSRAPFLMLRCFIPIRPVIEPQFSLLCITDMQLVRNVSMPKGFRRLSMVCSHPLFCLLLVGWLMKPTYSISSWLRSVVGWLHCHLSFALLCSAIMCIHSSRSSKGYPVQVDV